MIEQIYNYFTIEMLYFWVNLGVLPFWLVLIFFPQSYLCRYFVTSIFPIFILCIAYIFILYKSYLNSYNFIDNFNLYLGMNSLKKLFNEDSFLIAFWLHFLAINLFCGSWIVKDSHKYLMPKISTFFPLIITYFIGPLGIVLYWFIRIFFAKKINLYD